MADEIQDQPLQNGGDKNGPNAVADEIDKTKTPVLDAFSRDLTKMAAENKLEAVIGREKEIERLIQILSRKKKNNPVLIGFPGTGKCICNDTLVTIRNDKSGEVTKVAIKDFIKHIS